jgi:hypothetical protein
MLVLADKEIKALKSWFSHLCHHLKTPTWQLAFKAITICKFKGIKDKIMGK